jgi:ADP-ribose pyrophosphatase YjhB (NUDIX family)
MKTINALIIQDKKLLVVKKNDYWILPGGKLEYNEDDISCLKREIGEELSNTKLIIKNYYKTFKGITPKSKKFLESKCYFCEVEGEIGNPSNEIVLKYFVNASCVHKYNFSKTTESIIVDLYKEGLIL